MDTLMGEVGLSASPNLPNYGFMGRTVYLPCMIGVGKP